MQPSNPAAVNWTACTKVGKWCFARDRAAAARMRELPTSSHIHRMRSCPPSSTKRWLLQKLLYDMRPHCCRRLTYLIRIRFLWTQLGWECGLQFCAAFSGRGLLESPCLFVPRQPFRLVSLYNLSRSAWGTMKIEKRAKQKGRVSLWSRMQDTVRLRFRFA